MSDYSKIDAEVEAQKETIIDVASKIWDLAELGYREFESSAYVAETMEKNGFTISDRGIGGLETSWIATAGSGSPVVGFLVEFDALPGLGNDIVPTKAPAKNGKTSGHGCGHNLIASASVGASIALKNYCDKNDVAGTIKVFGCPAEEMLNGKNYMAISSAFEGLDFCLHNHPGMINTVWNFHSAASIDLWIEWFGTTAHAGAAPWDGRSALQAAEVFLVAANMMREHMLPTARLHYQILDGGMAVNVVPDYSKLLVRYRGPSANNIKKYVKWIKDIAQGAALATQTRTKVTNLGGIHDCLPNDVMANCMNGHNERYFPVPWTNEDHAFAKSIQKEMGMRQDGMAVEVLPVPVKVEVGGSSDVGDVSWKVPTMGAIYASWPLHVPPHQWGCTASNGTSIGHRASIQAAHVMAATAMDLMIDGDLLKAAKDEFAKRTEGVHYESLCETPTNLQGKLDGSERHHYECCIHAAMEHFGIKEEPHEH